ncbi:hypothetical protein [Salegentibacter sediminis]|uniref:hypothetical protein n=1 Tax=Salegentibacter sediminis TaxID=1930251 RepID=UPI0009C17FF0|nr:hypothetical protein [Salegentibacter sediminis]
MIVIRKHISLALGYFFLVALLGVVLRLFSFADVPATFRFLVHTHSHVALLGWVYVGLTSIIYMLFLKNAGIDKVYRRIFWFTQLTILGMLVSFPFQGYALFSIIFSTLFLIASYFFAWMVFTKTPVEFRTRFSYKCIRTSLIYMIISSVGPWALGAIMSTLGSTSIWYKLAIYFYLHFQYNGWFILALCGMLFFIVENNKLEIPRRDFKLFFIYINVAILLTFFLSVLWTQPNTIFYNLAGIGAVVQVFAFLKFHRILKFSGLGDYIGSFSRQLLIITAWVLVVKLLAQLFSALPYFADLAYRTPDFVIAYLHWTFLGLISPVLFALLQYFKMIRLPRIGFWIFFAGFLVTECILVYRGMAMWQRWQMPEDIAVYLFAGSCLFPIGIGWILLTNLKRSA